MNPTTPGDHINTKTSEELMKSLGGEWNSAYGHWEFRLSETRTKIFINPDEVEELSARIRSRDQQIALDARIDENSRYWKMLETGNWRSFGTEVDERLSTLKAKGEK